MVNAIIDQISIYIFEYLPIGCLIGGDVDREGLFLPTEPESDAPPLLSDDYNTNRNSHETIFKHIKPNCLFI